MWKSLKATKFVLWIVFIFSAVFLILFFGLNSIFASSKTEPVIEDNQPLQEVVLLSLEIRQRDGRLIATSDSDDATSWQYVGPNPVSSCSSTLFNSFDQQIRSGREVILETSDYGYYYCFRVVSTDGEYVYQSYLVFYDGQLIEITQDLNNQNQIVLSAEYQREVENWQYSDRLSDNVCFEEVFAEPAQIGNSNSLIIDQLNLFETDSELTDIYYCFRAEIEDGSWVYRNHLLKFTKPVFVWEIEDDQLSVEVDGLSITSGEYVVKDTGDTGCALEDFADQSEVSKGNLIPINQASPSSYCFRIKDEARVYHYNLYAPDNS